MLIDCLSCFGRFIFAFLLFKVTVRVLVALNCAKVTLEVLVALHLCIQSHSKGFGGSASAHTNQAVDFWWIYLFVGVTHKLHRV
jgi:hypothetical protein